MKHEIFNKFKIGGELSTHYELDVECHWEDGTTSVETSTIEKDVFEDNELIMYFISFMSTRYRHMQDVFDWFWFDGMSDVAWFVLNDCSTFRHHIEDHGVLNGTHMLKLYCVVGGIRIPVDVPPWDSLFENEDDKTMKMDAAVDEWYCDEL